MQLRRSKTKKWVADLRSTIFRLPNWRYQRDISPSDPQGRIERDAKEEVVDVGYVLD